MYASFYVLRRLAWPIIGSDVAEDILVMENPQQPEWLWGAAISEGDGRWLELLISQDTSRVCFSASHRPPFNWS